MQTVENGAEILQQLARALGVTDADKYDGSIGNVDPKIIKQTKERIKNQKNIDKLKKILNTSISNLSKIDKSIIEAAKVESGGKDITKYINDAKKSLEKIETMF